jgi:hypothetical protein
MKLEDYSEYYIQGTDYYLIPKDVFKELFNEMINWKEESQKQKEVIDKATNWTIKYQTEWCQEDEVIRDLKQLLDILNEVSE